MNITVVALGKIGLPLAVQYAEKGHRVFGADVNPEVVEQVNRGEEPFPGERDLAEKLAKVVADGRLTALTDTTSAVAESDVVVVVVPLFVDTEGIPDWGWMDAATEAIGQGLQPGTLVCYETTLPVGTTRERWKPMLENFSGLVEGTDFHVAFSPERVFTGRVFADLRRYPKLVGALSEAGALAAGAFYESVLDFDERPDLERPNGVWDLGSPDAAEMAKLAETTYRDVNIALANQFALFAQGHSIDVYRVIEAANSQPYSHIHQPGVAVGGHCIPVYPQMYLWNDPEATVVRAAREANASMPCRTVEALSERWGDLNNARVVILGVAYRGGVKEAAFSGVFPLVSLLEAAGAKVTVQDPLFSASELHSLRLDPHVPGQSADILIVQANHTEYLELTSGMFPGIQLVIDGRNCLPSGMLDDVEVLTLGRASVTKRRDN